MFDSTSKLEISDLSFCELVVEEVAEITGGFLFTVNSSYLYEHLPQQLFNILPLEIEVSRTKEIFYDSGTVVNKLENVEAGLSGYEVLSNGGKSRSVVLTGNNTVKAISTSSSFSFL